MYRLSAIFKHTYMKQFFAIVLSIATCQSCVMDSVYSCKIKNNSTQTIQVKISFDRDYFDKIYRGQKQTYISFLKENMGNDSGVFINNFDTINLTSSYSVLPKTIFTLEHGMSAPNYFSYKNITIINKDTLVLNNKEEIDNAFKPTDGNYLITVN